MTENNRTNLDLSAMDLKQLQEQIVSEILAGKSLLGQGGLLTPLIKSALEATLEGEMEAHLEESHINKNRRNGKSTKTVTHSAGSFEPEIVKKRQTVLNDTLDEKVLGLFSLV